MEDDDHLNSIWFWGSTITVLSYHYRSIPDHREFIMVVFHPLLLGVYGETATCVHAALSILESSGEALPVVDLFSDLRPPPRLSELKRQTRVNQLRKLHFLRVSQNSHCFHGY